MITVLEKNSGISCMIDLYHYEILNDAKWVFRTSFDIKYVFKCLSPMTHSQKINRFQNPFCKIINHFAHQLDMNGKEYSSQRKYAYSLQ